MEVFGVCQIKTGRRGAAVLAPVHPLVGSAVAKRFIVAGTVHSAYDMVATAVRCRVIVLCDGVASTDGVLMSITANR